MEAIVEKTYKDTVIKKLLKEKERAIEVANALLDKNIPNDTEVIIHELKDTLSARYNDIAFQVGDIVLMLIEHQSTINSNMALRLLIYFSKILGAYYIKMDKLYSSKLYKMPTPVFYVLYNGEKPLEKEILCLSDHFGFKHEFSAELKVKIIDINRDTGNEILERSPSLKGYSQLIGLIKDFMKQGASRDEAVKKAIKICINEKILDDFLKINFEEIINMFDIEYNKELELAVIGREEREEGRQEGRQEGKQEEKKETAITMLEKGFDKPTIAEIIKMPMSWIEEIATSNRA